MTTTDYYTRNGKKKYKIDYINKKLNLVNTKSGRKYENTMFWQGF